jgi:putative ABC transport system ATP-binding protein
MDLIHGLHAEGTTIVVITHDLDVASEFPRQISVLDGRIESDLAGGVDLSARPKVMQQAVRP